MKYTNMSNPVVLEGLWGTGKSTVAGLFSEAYAYRFVPEPSHLDDPMCDLTDIRTWYLNAHKRQESELCSAEPTIMERSILSTYAYDHAIGRELPDKAAMHQLTEIFRTSSVLLVYLMPADGGLPPQEDEHAYDSNVRKILDNTEAVRRYHEFFTQILPWRYGIVPLILNVTQNQKRKKPEIIATEIRAAIGAQRVAQVNIVCLDVSTSSSAGPRILLMRRTQERGGFWQAVTGGMHPGEVLNVAARREVFEETAVALAEHDLIPTGLSYSFIGNDQYLLHEYVFAAIIRDPSRLKRSDEHDEETWLAPEPAQDLLAYETNKQAIAAAVGVVGIK